MISLNAAISSLREREQGCLAELATIRRDLADRTARREELAARVRARLAAGATGVRPQDPAVPAPPPAVPAVPPAAPVPATAAPVPATAASGSVAGREVSGFGIQTLLFVIGGLLLGTGAVVFMVVAWTRFGLLGQASTLLFATAAALAAPVVARWRRLPGTAETTAVIAALMLLLDGYAAWRGGLVTALPGTGWAACVCAGTAVAALGYGRWVGLRGPRFAALLLAQPVLPLAAARPLETLPDLSLTLTGYAYLLVLTAAADLWVCARLTRGALRVLGWVAAGTALVTGAVTALLCLIATVRPAGAALAGGALVAAVAVLALLARITRTPVWQTVTVTAAFLTAPLLAGKLVSLSWPRYTPLVAAGVVALAALVGRRLPAGPLRRGHRLGGWLAVGGLGLWLGGLGWWAANELVIQAPELALPLALAGPYHWQVPAALVLLVVPLSVLTPAARVPLSAAVAALVAVTAPVSLSLPGWTAVAASLAVAVGSALLAARAPATVAYPLAVLAAGLTGYGLLIGRGDLTAVAVGLGTVVLAGSAMAGLSRGSTVVGRGGLLTGLLAVPAAVAAGVAAAGFDPPGVARAALAGAVALLAVATVLRRFGADWLGPAAGAVHVVTPVAVLAGVAEGGWAVAGYAGVGLLTLVALGLVRRPAGAGRWLLARAPLAGVVGLALLPSALAVVAAPYAWLTRIWSGRPKGTGLLPPGTTGPVWSVVDPLAPVVPVVMALLALLAAAGLAGRVVAGRWSAGGAAVLLALPPVAVVGAAAVAAPWPVPPAVSLLAGGAAVGWAAVRGSGHPWTPLATGYGVALTGAGLAGALPMVWSTLAGLGFVLVLGAVVAAAGRPAAARVAGWVTAAGAGVLLAVAVARAANAPAPVVGFAVLGVAALVLAVSAFARVGRPERAAGEASAHAAAVVALVLLLRSPELAAVAAVAWGVALAARAWSASGPGRPVRLIAGAASHLIAWWLLLVSVEVALVEAYTLPVALLGLGAGAWVRRTRPGLTSWVGYGAGLAAALLPSLALSLADPVPLRRLLLGVGALAVLLWGARARLQAPVVGGGLVLAVLAVRELALVWQRLDAWIPLTVAGLLLVGLAATYERRRRDLTRLTAALRRLA